MSGRENMDSPFGPGAVLHHIGVAVASIANARPGLETTSDPIQKVSVAFISLHGVTLELVEPAAEDSPVSARLKNGDKLLHLCYAVPDLLGALDSAAHNGFRCIRPPAPATAYEGRRIAWVYSPVFGLIELLEA